MPHHLLDAIFFGAGCPGGRGFEPRLTAPKTAVLPLDDPPPLVPALSSGTVYSAPPAPVKPSGKPRPIPSAMPFQARTASSAGLSPDKKRDRRGPRSLCGPIVWKGSTTAVNPHLQQNLTISLYDILADFGARQATGFPTPTENSRANHQEIPIQALTQGPSVFPAALTLEDLTPGPSPSKGEGRRKAEVKERITAQRTTLGAFERRWLFRLLMISRRSSRRATARGYLFGSKGW